jgi:hypothetical protein
LDKIKRLMNMMGDKPVKQSENTRSVRWRRLASLEIFGAAKSSAKSAKDEASGGRSRQRRASRCRSEHLPWLEARIGSVAASKGQNRYLDGDFAGADDLLWMAQSGGLPGLGQVRVERSGQVGPLVEMLMGRRADPVAFAEVRFAAPFARVIEQALAVGKITGSDYQARHGVFPLSRFAETGDGAQQWALWRSRAEQAAVAIGFPRPLAAAIIGAIGELQENVFRHSHRPETGLVAYATTASAFEVVVADAGVGVLASLRENPDYAGVLDAGAALKIAVQDGETRFGRASGGGFGMGQMFRALANHDGELRFRSDDHTLAVRGHSPRLQGGVELGHKARLGGLTISVRCHAPNRASRGP